VNFKTALSNQPPDSLTCEWMPELIEFKNKIISECKVPGCFSGSLPGDVLCECMREVHFRYRILSSNIPPKYRDASFDNFVNKKHVAYKEVVGYSKNLVNARTNGIGLHTHSSKSGTGKTLLNACVLIEACRQGYWVWFTSMSQLMEDIRNGYDDSSKREIIEWAMFKTDFLMLDEITKTHDASGWVEDRTNDLIQRRVNDNRPILATDNHPIAKLTGKYRDHLISRFAGQQHEVSVESGLDYRVHHQKENIRGLLYGGGK